MALIAALCIVLWLALAGFQPVVADSCLSTPYISIASKIQR